MAEWNALKGPTNVLPTRYGQSRADQNGGNHARTNCLAIDLVANECGEYERALRVTDEYETASAVLVLEVVVPRIPNIIVLKAVFKGRRSGSAG